MDSESSIPPTPTATSLSTFEIFAGLPRQDLAEIAQLMKSRNVVAGTHVISTAQKAKDVFFIVGGKVRACAFSQQGKQIYFEDLEAGMMFGELAAIDGGDRSNDCIAVDTSMLAVLPEAEFRNVVKSYAAVQEALMKRLVGLVRRQMQRVYEFSSFSVSQRLRFELLRLASDAKVKKGPIVLARPPTHMDIASRISSHREAVTRELKHLESAGIITWRPGEYIIHDIEKLARIAVAQ